MIVESIGFGAIASYFIKQAIKADAGTVEPHHSWPASVRWSFEIGMAAFFGLLLQPVGPAVEDAFNSTADTLTGLHGSQIADKELLEKYVSQM